MTQSSFSFLFSSSSSTHRLVTLITILLLNPLPIIFGAPTQKSDKDLTAVQRHKRQIYVDDDALEFNEHPPRSEPEVVFEGLIGCKYDQSVCNEIEACFDDGLFGQCWDGEGSTRSAFALKSGVDGLADDQLIAVEQTLDFLNRYHLNWKDYMTQCILSHIFSAEHQINRNRLELFYHDCLNKDEVLDQLAAVQEENAYRRQLQIDDENPNLYYVNPYAPFLKADDALVRLEKPYAIPVSIEYERPGQMDMLPISDAFSRLLAVEEAESNEIDSEERLLEYEPEKFVAEESMMTDTKKVSISTKELNPSLVQLLQINNNKQGMPLLTEDTMAHEQLTNDGKGENNTNAERFFAVEIARGYIIVNRDFKDQLEGAKLLALLARMNTWPGWIFTDVSVDHRILSFRVETNDHQINASSVASEALNNQKEIENELNLRITDSGIGNPRRGARLSVEQRKNSRLTVVTLVTCILVLFMMAAFVLLYYIKRNDRIRNKLAEITHFKGLSTNYYQDLCRQRMQVQPTNSKSSDIPKVHQTSPSTTGPTITPASSHVKHNSEGSSTRSSTSSWSEEPVAPVNMDIMTGHLILSYMEDHLRNRHRLEAEWQALCTDEANEERASCSIALSEANANKNRYIDCIPYDHARVRLANNADGDYVNASIITDSDPKCKYIATQGPMPNTTNAFWQMVWEQGSCVIVALTRPIENGITMCHHYWPVEGSARFNDFEVNLVSEHIWSDDYLVRSFYLKNVQTMETRTVTQFHFLTWGELNNPPSAKALLDFRRKVNKCFRGRSSPIIVHCNDGVGRTGTFILLDIVLNRICKGAREINIDATLEHIRDQRAKMVKTKDQFEFVFVAVAEEVTYLLKALPQ